MPSLIVKSGPGAGKRFELDTEVVVGRGDVDCVIDDAELSRRHLTVRVTASGAVEIEDLGSLNGTWVKGKRVEGALVIADGGAFRIGETEIVVEAAAPATKAEPTVIAPVARPVAASPPEAAPAPPPEAAPSPPEAAPPPPPPEAAPAPPPPPPEAAAPPPVEAPPPDYVDAPPTNIPVKRRAAKPTVPAPAPDPGGDAPTIPPPTRRRPAADPASPPSSSRRPAASPPSSSRRPAASPPSRSRRPSPAAAGQLGAFAPPTKPGRRKVATRLVLPAMVTFMAIFATAIALLVYFATR